MCIRDSGLIDVKEIKRRWPRSGKSDLMSPIEVEVRSPDIVQKNLKSHHSFIYNAIIGNERVQVCFPAFMLIYSITEKKE